jgi:hypothetical protein
MRDSAVAVTGTELEYARLGQPQAISAEGEMG